jgi:Xaa-Pro aminopeptidase
MLQADGCQRRQSRLLECLQHERWDLFVTGNYRTVYYLTGALTPDAPTGLALWQDGYSVLITSLKDTALATKVVPLETYSIQRSITEPVHDAASLLANELQRKQGANVSRYAIEIGTTPAVIANSVARLWPQVESCDATRTLLRLRKRKEEDEIEEIRASLRLCATAYSAARNTIAEGLTEIDIFNAMQEAANCEAGTSVLLSGDFACGERGIRGGGPPTSRRIQANDLFILDLFPAPALYFGDTCRTFAVGEPTDLQFNAWESVRHAMQLGEAAIKPGVAAKDVYDLIKGFLDSKDFLENSFWHHAGHGIGHHGHEAPRLIPGSTDTFEEGDVFTLEPGVYTRALHGGIRLEDNYVVRDNGIENLFDFSLKL